MSVIESKEIVLSLNEDEYICYLNTLQSKNQMEKFNYLLNKNKLVFNFSYDKHLPFSNKIKKTKSILFECPTIIRMSAEDYINQFKIPELTNDKKVKKDVLIFKYYLAKTLSGGDIFGDIAFNNW